MRHVALRSLLVCSLALAAGVPAHAHAHALAVTTATAPKAAESPRQGRIFVDASKLGDAGPYLAGEATRRAGDVLVEQGVKKTDAPAGPELRVTIEPGETTGYSVSYEIVYDGDVIEDGTGASDCQLCTEGELLELVDAIAKEQAPKMVEPKPEPETVDPEEGEGNDVELQPPGGDDGTQDQPKGMGGMGKAGIALLVGGGVAAGVGVGLVVRKPTNLPSLDSEANKLQSTRPTGAILLGGGGALVITGAVLLALDVKRRKKAREGGDAQARVAPWMGPSGAGLSITGRF